MVLQWHCNVNESRAKKMPNGKVRRIQIVSYVCIFIIYSYVCNFTLAHRHAQSYRPTIEKIQSVFIVLIIRLCEFNNKCIYIYDRMKICRIRRMQSPNEIAEKKKLRLVRCVHMMNGNWKQMKFGCISGSNCSLSL